MDGGASERRRSRKCSNWFELVNESECEKWNGEVGFRVWEKVRELRNWRVLIGGSGTRAGISGRSDITVLQLPNFDAHSKRITVPLKEVIWI